MKEEQLFTMLSHHLSNSLYPVSQVLFSERCINEPTLDEMETLETSLEEKKMILLSAIRTEISSNHKKFNVLATALSKNEETKYLSERIISEFGKK